VNGRFLRAVPAGLAVVAVVMSLSGCQEVEPTAAAAVYEPSKVEVVKGLDVPQVTFTKRGAAEVSLETAVAELVGGQTVVPYAALIYDYAGASWVYTSKVDLAYVRVPVVVDRIEGDQVWLSEGLLPGERVVTVGAAEVYGAELGIGGSH